MSDLDALILAQGLEMANAGLRWRDRHAAEDDAAIGTCWLFGLNLGLTISIEDPTKAGVIRERIIGMLVRLGPRELVHVERQVDALIEVLEHPNSKVQAQFTRLGLRTGRIVLGAKETRDETPLFQMCVGWLVGVAGGLTAGDKDLRLARVIRQGIIDRDAVSALTQHKMREQAERLLDPEPGHHVTAILEDHIVALGDGTAHSILSWDPKRKGAERTCIAAAWMLGLRVGVRVAREAPALAKELRAAIDNLLRHNPHRLATVSAQATSIVNALPDQLLDRFQTLSSETARAVLHSQPDRRFEIVIGWIMGLAVGLECGLTRREGALGLELAVMMYIDFVVTGEPHGPASRLASEQIKSLLEFTLPLVARMTPG